MAMDFTGVTNVFMGGDVSGKTTSLQGVYKGENELWNYTDKGYRWRMMGNTINGNESFSVGDVVCFGYGTTSMWTNMADKTAKDCLIPTNYREIFFNQNTINISSTFKMEWSDEIGSDGKVIGWHLPSDKLLCQHSYRVAETYQNGAYAKFRTNSAYYLTTKSTLGAKFMSLEAGASSFWGTVGATNDPFNYYKCYINERNTSNYMNGPKTTLNVKYWSCTTSSPSGYNVIFKRVKIAQ